MQTERKQLLRHPYKPRQVDPARWMLWIRSDGSGVDITWRATQ